MRAGKPIRVVAGWIEWKGRILLTRRLPGEVMGGYWELPGGKVEEGETLQDALSREIEEELGIGVLPKRPLAEVLHCYSHALIHLVAVYAKASSPMVERRGCSESRWLLPREVLSLLQNRHLTLAPADRRLILQVFKKIPSPP